jgi:hypothetical protein
MTPLAWLVAAGVVPWLVSLAVGGSRTHPELLYGMLAPLAATSATWVVTERTYRRRPASLTGVMVAALMVKAVFFGVYVVVMLRMVGVRPAPFIAGFTGYFVVLYGLEALFLKRLFAGGFGR